MKYKSILRDLPKIKNVDGISNKLDYYEAARRNIKPINNKTYNFQDIKPKVREDGNSNPFFYPELDKNTNNDQTYEFGLYSTQNHRSYQRHNFFIN